MSHDHHHPDRVGGHVDARAGQRRVLRVVLAANLATLVAEVVGGVVFGSLALLADAAHLAADVGGLAIALIAHGLMDRPPSDRHSFGLQRAEVLGAQANGVLLVASSGWIVYEALRRVGEPVDISGPGLLAVATIGLGVNLASAVALARVAGSSLNMRGALTHMIADAAGSGAAIVAGIAVVTASLTWVDGAASVAIAVLVLWAAWRLLRDAAHVVLEGTPVGLDLDEIRDAMVEAPGVTGVHHVHMWSLASDVPALSAHLVVEGDIDLHEAQARGDQVRSMLQERFGVSHTTLELECHDCESDTEEIR